MGGGREAEGSGLAAGEAGAGGRVEVEVIGGGGGVEFCRLRAGA